MKRIVAYMIGAALIPAFISAQNITRRRPRSSDQPELSVRAQSLFGTDQPSEADVQWMRGIYRAIDLTEDKNMPLYYPEEPMENQQNLFRMLMKLLAENKIPAYDYLDGRELFTDSFKLNVKEMLDRFHILYQEKDGSTPKKPRFIIEESDIPANEVLSYYIKEKWVFDQRESRFYAIVEALCPVLHRTGDFGGEAMKYPMFWVKFESLRPYLAQQYILTDNENNVLHYTYDDYFRLRMYEGEIYKTTNLRNMSLMQMYPGDSALTAAREKIENQLKMFDESLWVKPAEETAVASSKTSKVEKTEKVAAEGTPAVEPEKKSTVRSARSTRGTSAKRESSVKKSSSSGEKAKSAPVRSVRRRR